jgi:hypothetical protein
MTQSFTSRPGEVLVAIINNLVDLAIAREQCWYRIPVETVEKRLKRYWPPAWVAFYQTKVFEAEAYSINYYAQVIEITNVRRSQLFPDDFTSKTSHKLYFKLQLAPLKQLPNRIYSPRYHRITFIPTTFTQLMTAVEINDLVVSSRASKQRD